jgi:PAS domain S-box-containing protein
MEPPLILDILIAMMVVSGASMAVLGIYGRRFIGRVPAAVPYVILMFFTAGWAFLYALDLLSPALPEKIFFHNLRFIVLPFIPLLELWLIVAYLKKKEWLRPDWAAILLIIPVLAVILALTSQYHTLFRYDFAINTSGPVTVLQYSDSTFYQVYNIYNFLILVLAVVILITESRKRGMLSDMQPRLLFFALAIPMAINYLSLAGFTPVPGINMTPPFLWISALLYTIALFRYRFLDIVPIARSRLIETMSAPMLVLDTESRIIDINPAACSLFSTSPESAVGKTVGDIVPDWPEFVSLCGSDGTCPHELTREYHGGTRHYTGSVELLFTSSGEIEGRLVLLQDITGQKNAEIAMRESEEKFSRAFRSSPYAMTITSMPDGRIIDVNDGFEQITGYLPGDVLGQTTHDLNLWEREADRTSVIGDLANHIPVSGREFRFRAKSGRIMTGLFSADIIMVGNRPFVLSSISDITERRLAEEQRESLVRELEQKNAELDRFTSTVSHDLKSPLITIRGYLGLLEEDIHKDPSQAQADISRINAAAETMEHLIDTLLELSRSGRTVDKPVSIPFSGIAREAAGLLETSLRDRGIVLDIPDNLPVVYGDRDRLLQVMINLLDNAMKYMGDQKEPRIEVGVRTDAGVPVFFVQDNGMGISKNNLPKVFTLFERFSPDIPGTGIGLATVRRIIEAHGGSIRVESEGEGRGTIFRFTLRETES